jgi:hypothetical protein
LHIEKAMPFECVSTFPCIIPRSRPFLSISRCDYLMQRK